MGLRIVACPILLSLLCLGQTQGTTTLVVTVPVVDMYSAPNPDADVVSQAIYGSNTRMIEENQGWVKVQTADQYTGWLSLDSVKRLHDTEAPYASSGRTVQVESLSANLYREPDVTSHRPLLTVPFETKLELVSEGKGENERWLQVRLVDQRVAWIQAGDTNTAPRSLTIEESIALGRRFLGVTYTWGGRSSFGV
jgi:SH3-like domain-containing protein